MTEIHEKIEKNWALLLNQRSQNYLVRSKIDQNIAIANSNLSASFMGNRQLANHNTADIKYNLTKIAAKNLKGTNSEIENIELVFLKHQQRLNKKLAENSQGLIEALEKLQLAHSRVMKTNEEIIKFNASLIDSTSKIIQTNQLPQSMQLSDESIVSELEKIEMNTAATNGKLEKLSAKVDEISKFGDKLSAELDLKREKIKENRDRVSSIRADLSLWTE
tara:strand:+ start:667 stop:1326 length:660 start_codon:yes stop_codon:yes gene_type:complete